MTLMRFCPRGSKPFWVSATPTTTFMLRALPEMSMREFGNLPSKGDSAKLPPAVRFILRRIVDPGWPGRLEYVESEKQPITSLDDQDREQLESKERFASWSKKQRAKRKP